ncbi:barstar family protein [Amycolatopsis sp. NPDC054798]
MQNAWFVSGKDAMRYGTGDLVLDGRELPSKDSFYCALGEAANGPGGYFGSNLDALNDCLRSGSGSPPRYSVLWNAAAASRRVLGDAFVDAVAEVFRDHGVELRER